MGVSRDDKALPSGQELSELEATFRIAPHAWLDQLRREAPRYLDPSSAGKRLFLTRHADVRTALFDRTLTRDAAKAPTRGQHDAAAGTLLAMEGNEHRIGRKLVARAFAPQAVEAWRAPVTAIVDTLLDDIERKQDFDGIADFAAPLPLIAISKILGLPETDIAALRAWAEDAGVLNMLPSRTLEQDARLASASSSLLAYIKSAIKAHRSAPGAGLISELLAVDLDGVRLGDETIAPLCMLLLVAGSLTTTDVIGNAVALLLQHPEQLALLRADPDLIDNAVEEVLRFDPPVSAVARHAAESREVLDCPLPAGGTVKASLIAANRDPDVFAHPHAFRIDRAEREQLAFGGGAHTCPGAQLARMEAAVALGRLLARFPNLRMTGEAPRKITYGFRGFARLPLSIR